MKQQINARSRKELKSKMATVFNENIKTLSTDLQGVLLDDLITALENRLTVLNRINQNSQLATGMTGCVEFETIET